MGQGIGEIRTFAVDVAISPVPMGWIACGAAYGSSSISGANPIANGMPPLTRDDDRAL